MIRRTLRLMAGGALLAALLMGTDPAAAQGKKIVLAIPGVPPIYSVTIAYVAEKQRFFKKYGADVTIRPFDNGTAAARAVVAGDIDLAWSPTPPVINQVSNADVPLAAVYGMPNPDWVDRHHGCRQDLQRHGRPGCRGQFDQRCRFGGLALNASRLPGVKFEDVKQVALGSSPARRCSPAGCTSPCCISMTSPRSNIKARSSISCLAMKNTNPTSHYLIMVVRKDNLAKNRDAIVRTVAGMIEAARFMQDPKNANSVAEAAAVTGHDKDVNKAALKAFLDINFWAANDDGMPRNKIEAVAALMKKIGSIKPDKEPVSYDKFVDASVWKDANAMVK